MRPLALAAVLGVAALGQAPRPTVTLAVQLGHANVIPAVAVSSDGRFVVTGSADYAAVVWEVATGREVRRFSWHLGSINAVAIDANGHVVSGGADGSLVEWSVQSGEPLMVYVPPPAEPRNFERYDRGGATSITSVAIDPRGGLVAAGTRAGVELYDRSSGRDAGRLVRRRLGLAVFGPVTAVAFMSGGRILVAEETGEVRLWDVDRKEPLRAFSAHRKTIGALAVANDGAFFASGSDDSTVAIWELESAAPAHVLRHDAVVRAVAISGDGRRVLTSAGAGRIALWDAGTGQLVRQFRDLPTAALAIEFAPDGAWAVTGTSAGVPLLLSIEHGVMYQAFWPLGRRPLSLALSARDLLVGTTDSLIGRWDIIHGRAVRPLRAHRGGVAALAVTPDGDRALSGGGDSAVIFWDLRPGTGRSGRRYQVHRAPIGCVALHPAGRLAATASDDGAIAVWTLAPLGDRSDDSVRWLSAGAPVRALAISSDGRRLAAATRDGLRIWDLATNRSDTPFRREDTDQMTGAAAVLFSPNGRYVLGAAGRGDIRIWEVTGAEISQRLGHRGPVSALAFDPSGDWFYSSGADKVVRRWRIDREAVEASYAGHSSEVAALAISPDGRLLASAAWDGTVRLWRPASRQLIATLVTGTSQVGDDLKWTVVAPDGRFETNALEEAESGLSWVMTDDPMRPIPVEVFTRGYYERGLLHKRLAAEPLPPVPDPAGLNRVQPRVTLEVRPIPGRPAEAAVTVAAWTSEGSNAYDLRLFRDGQLVAQWPHPQIEPPRGDLAAWRAAHRLEMDPVSRAEHIDTVRLPRRSRVDTVVFSAYAFNADRVKSATARLPYLPPQAVPGPRRAYVIAVGVGDNEEPTRRLTFAASDAAIVMDSLQRALARSQVFDVVRVPMMKGSGTGVLQLHELPNPAVTPTKANIHTVLDLLAGRPVDAARRAAIPPAIAASLRRAEPQDMVLLYIAAHGLIDPARDDLVLLPLDIGNDPAADLTAAQLARGISSDELAQWLRDIDAGSLTMILSTCYSQSAVERAGFRPAPLGEAGLGQLAYDKGMQILVAAQSDAVASELTFLGRALMNGLETDRYDKATSLADLLRFAERRVPELLTDQPASRRQDAQLFDFRRGRPDVLFFR